MRREQAEALKPLLKTLDWAAAKGADMHTQLLAVVSHEGDAAGAERTAAVLTALTEARTTLGELKLGALADEVEEQGEAAGNGFAVELVGVSEGLRRADRHMPPTGGSADQTIAAAKQAAEDLDGAVTSAALLVATGDIERRLVGAPAGRALPAGECFASLDDADRKEVLARVSEHSKALDDAWIDEANGQVYKLPTGLDRAWRYATPPVALAAMAGGAALAGVLISNKQPLGTPQHMLIGLGYVLLGALVHFVANVFKQDNNKTTPAVVDTWRRYLLLRPQTAPWLLIAPVTTLVILALLGTDWRGIQGLGMFFLAGYSCDSLTRAAFSRLDGIANKTAASLLPTTTTTTTTT